MGKLRPENDARRRELAPDCARRLHAGEFRHLNVEYGNLRLVLKRKLHSFFAVSGFDDGRVRRKLFFQYLAQVVTLGHIVFGDQNGHRQDDSLKAPWAKCGSPQLRQRLCRACGLEPRRGRMFSAKFLPKLNKLLLGAECETDDISLLRSLV